MKDMKEFITRNAANIFYIAGSICLLVGTLINITWKIK